MTHTTRQRLHVEPLEVRDVPAGTIETFDTTALPGLPVGWSRWSSDGSAGFATSAGRGVANSVGLVTTGASGTAALAWAVQPAAGNDGVAVSVRADTLVPTFALARGTDLGTATPSYLAAVVTRGLQVELREVSNGTVRVLGSVKSAAYLSGPWVRVTLVPTDGSATVQVTRSDTGQFLTPAGAWQAGRTAALTAATTLPSASGHVGVGRAGRYSGAVGLDNFEVLPGAPTQPAPTPAAAGVKQSFDTTAAGATPTGWQSWTAGARGSFAVTRGPALSPGNGFTSSGSSTTASRSWAAADLPRDVEASAAVYLNGLIPARVFVRGAGLDTATPTYYAATVTRGLGVSLVRVANGVETPLGSVRSADYVTNQWVRLRVVAEGDRLRVVVYRADTGKWLGGTGRWSDGPDYALEVRDRTIAAAGRAGVGRAAAYSGAVTFDDFEAKPAGTSALGVSVTTADGPAPFKGDVTFTAAVSGVPKRVEFRLDNVLRSVAGAGSPNWTLDTTSLTNGKYTLTVRASDAAGNVGDAEFPFTVSNPNAEPLPVPAVPRHYTHIRIAQLAYSGNPMGAFEQQLLRDSVDLVVPNPRFLATIQGAAPDTPQLIYSNVSNLYQGLLTDWLAYADRVGVPRESAFYHVTAPTAFTGASASSQPVTWFWGAAQTGPGGTAADVTSAIRGGRTSNVNFGGTGTTTSVGYVEKFREMNVAFVTGAAAGWAGVWEYVSAAAATGEPTAWKTLAVSQDGTSGMKQSGAITFDPPADWVPAAVAGDAMLYHVRFRVTAGTAGQAPELRSLFGRDYVEANGAQAGTIPAFDAAADRDGDGYLKDSEYAGRKAGMDARFAYESRLFYPYYGQMRFVTNPSSSAVRKWAAEYHVNVLKANPLADGFFMDNATGKLPFPGVSVAEATSTFGLDSGALVAAVSRAVAPRWILANTAGGGTDGNYTAAGAAGAFEEFALRPLTATWSQVGDMANLVATRLASGTDYLVLDSLPTGGSPTDPRTQLATLSYYYLLGDPERTFLTFYGGSNPSSSWTEHWSPAATVDVGKPTGPMRTFATGTDPADARLAYQVFARDYANALVLYKPLSYATGVGAGTTANASGTTHQLGGNYRAVNADGTRGPVITSITLRNGEGAVLMRA